MQPSSYPTIALLCRVQVSLTGNTNDWKHARVGIQNSDMRDGFLKLNPVGLIHFPNETDLGLYHQGVRLGEKSQPYFKIRNEDASGDRTQRRKATEPFYSPPYLSSHTCDWDLKMLP